MFTIQYVDKLLQPQYKLRDWIDHKKLTCYLSSNPHPIAMNLIEIYPEKRNLWLLSKNPSDEAIAILERLAKTDPGKIIVNVLSKNRNHKAKHILDYLKQQGFKTCNWSPIVAEFDSYLSMSADDWALDRLEENYEDIVWQWFSMNPSPRAMKILEKNQDKIDWNFLSTNPGIFQEIK
jgi:hypothetical protein